MTIDLIQGSAEWHAARCGSLGASAIHEALARTKSGYSSQRANLRARLICERLTGVPQDTYQNDAMKWGIEKEPEARAAYAFDQDVDVTAVGLIRHPTIGRTHASPDGLIGQDGGLELKCPGSAAHLETLLSKSFPEKYTLQCLWGMACTGRKWWDLVSFDPRMPGELQLFVKRILRDEPRIVALELDITEFLAEVDTAIAQLTGTSHALLHDKLGRALTALDA
jgi:putative phage-type endonuclease